MKRITAPLIFCIIFYCVVCLLSIVVGTGRTIQYIHYCYTSTIMPFPIFELLNNMESMDSISIEQTLIFGGPVTIVVGIFQGLSALLLAKKMKFGWYLTFFFTCFSLVSVVYKLFFSISVFACVKTAIYIFIIFTLMSKSSRDIYLHH